MMVKDLEQQAKDEADRKAREIISWQFSVVQQTM